MACNDVLYTACGQLQGLFNKERIVTRNRAMAPFATQQDLKDSLTLQRRAQMFATSLGDWNLIPTSCL